MDSTVGNKNTGSKRSSVGSEQGPGAGSTFKKMPITLTKKELAQILECWRPGAGKPNYPKLKAKFFTDDVLSRIGITVAEYKKTVVFDRITTIKIIEVLEIENEAHEYAKDRI